jgi:Transcriptional regulatory protein, C terminal
MTKRPSPDRLLRRLPNVASVDTRPDPTYTLATGVETVPADGTVLDVVPLPGTDKVLMIVAHVVPARTVEATAAVPPAQPAEPGPQATNEPPDLQSNATTWEAKPTEPSTVEWPPEPTLAATRTPSISKPRPETTEPGRPATPQAPRVREARSATPPEAPHVSEAWPTETPETSRTPEARQTATPYAMKTFDVPSITRPRPGEPEEPGEEPRSETAAAANAGHPKSAETATSPPPDGLRVDRPSRRVLVNGREVHLTFQEFELLAHLTAHPWTVFTRAELMRALWPTMDSTTRTVDIHVHRLRRKLGRLSTQLTTVRRVGYVSRPHLTNRTATPTTAL